jgi:hypothetical protein
MLIILNATPLPTSFDVLDSDMGTFKGGEVVSFTSAPSTRLIANPNYNATTNPNVPQFITNPAYDKAAVDFEKRNFVGPATPNSTSAWGSRALVSKEAVTATSAVYLVDNGSNGYGPQFGSWLGGVAGQNQTEIAVGPTTDQTSGKVCLYRRGYFGVTLDSVASDLVPPTTATAWTTGGGALVPGAALYAMVGGATPGLLTSVSTNNKQIGTFIAYETQMGYVKSNLPYNPTYPYANLFMITFEFTGV